MYPPENAQKESNFKHVDKYTAFYINYLKLLILERKKITPLTCTEKEQF